MADDLLSELVGRLLTRPLDSCQIASVFGVSTRRVSDIIANTPGVVRVGRRYRFPLVAMPPEFFLETGLLNSDKLGQTLQQQISPNTTGSTSDMNQTGGQ